MCVTLKHLSAVCEKRVSRIIFCGERFAYGLGLSMHVCCQIAALELFSLMGIEKFKRVLCTDAYFTGEAKGLAV